MTKQLKQTPLYEWHVANGANMSEFSGYSMPLWYPGGVKDEHLSVIQGAGIFDTSHMAAITVMGADALDLLQDTFSKDLDRCGGKKDNPLDVERCVYGLFLDDEGGVIDDAIVYRLDTHIFMIVINAGMGAEITSLLNDRRGDRLANVTDMTDRLGKIDVQGPASAKILSKIIENPNDVFRLFNYFTFRGHFDESSLLSDDVRLLDGTPILLSRTGYTGEFGFEIFCAKEVTLDIWKSLLTAGEEFEVVPCGLAARDSLRVGAVLPLSRQDIGSWPFANNPWSFAMPYSEYNTLLTKKINGADALKEIENRKYTYPFVGFDPRKVVPGESEVLDEYNKKVGDVLTCVTDMAIERDLDNNVFSVATPDKPDMKIRGLSCGFVRLEIRLKEGTHVYLQDGKRKLKIELRSDIRPDRSARKSIMEFL